MSTDLKKALQAPFPEDAIEWRIGQCGKNQQGVWAKCLAYVEARAIMDRFDEVFGPAHWRVRYEIHSSGVLCALGVKFGDEWVEKVDGAEQTDFEPFKGGISGALKRAAVLWGPGRYLYNVEEGWAKIVPQGTKGARYGKTKENETFYWVPPPLPAWALPRKADGATDPAPQPWDSGGTRVEPQAATISKIEAEKIHIAANGNNWGSPQVIEYAKLRFGIDRLGQLKATDLEEFLATVSKRRPEVVFHELKMKQQSHPPGGSSKGSP